MVPRYAPHRRSIRPNIPQARVLTAQRPATVLLRLAVLTALLLAAFIGRAQVLFVNDNDNILENTDTLMNDLSAAGVVYDTYDIPTEGTPPAFSELDAHDLVIWYCSTDGVGLGFWDETAQDDLMQYILTGKKLWIIGQDLLYANYPAPPHTFQTGDFALDFMGLASYDNQSYGDDGAIGVNMMEYNPEVASYFSPYLSWVFPTLWWADGCTPAADATPIYVMGPDVYPLYGSPSMIHFHAPGTNVMSTLFDASLIDSFDNRVTFIEETIAYMDITTGIAVNSSTTNGLHFANPVTSDVLLSADAPLERITVHGTNGVLQYAVSGVNSDRHLLPTNGLASGVYVVQATLIDGRVLSARLVRE